MVVPRDTLSNITAALLTVQPGNATLPAGLFERATLSGMVRIAPQRVFRTVQSRLWRARRERSI